MLMKFDQFFFSFRRSSPSSFLQTSTLYQFRFRFQYKFLGKYWYHKVFGNFKKKKCWADKEKKKKMITIDETSSCLLFKSTRKTNKRINVRIKKMYCKSISFIWYIIANLKSIQCVVDYHFLITNAWNWFIYLWVNISNQRQAFVIYYDCRMKMN